MRSLMHKGNNGALGRKNSRVSKGEGAKNYIHASFTSL